MSDYQAPPQNLDAESSVIGSILLDNMKIDEVCEIVSAEDFYHPVNQRVFASIKDLRDSGNPVDVISVAESIGNHSEFATAGGMKYLGDLVRHTPTNTNVVSYSKIVKDKARRRSIIQIASSVIDGAYGEQDTDYLIDQLTTQSNLVSIDQFDSNQDIKTVLKRVTETMDKRSEMKGDTLIGLSTGLNDLDAMLCGLQAGKLHTLAARPAMGKSCLGINIIENAALSGKVTQMFTMEMTSDEVGMRVLSSQSGVDHGQIQSAKMEKESWARVASAFGRVSTSKMFIDDSTSLTMEKIKSRCRKTKALHGLDLVVIDYLGLMETANTGNYVQDISKITRGMKNMAKDLDVPVLLLCQLNRDCEKRQDKRPQLSDLRDSGAIEQDSNVVMFVYRDEVYDENSPQKGVAEIIVSKNRGGKIGTVRTLFVGENQKFKNFGVITNGV